jgi:cytochrome c556
VTQTFHSTTLAIVAAATAAVVASMTIAAPAPQNNKAFMTGVVAPAVKPIWDLGYAEKVTDADWANLKKSAADLNAAMATIASGGPVASEQARAKNPKWQEWSKKTADATVAAVRAVNAKNQMQLASAGDTLVETCEGCHMAFDPTAK